MFKTSWLRLAPALGEVLLLNKASNTKRRRLVVGNWKMNGSLQENAKLLTQIVSDMPVMLAVDAVICPPFPYLAQVSSLISGTPVMLGAQTVSEFEKGAYTGEVSAAMLADLNCKFVIIGHNERRRMQRETNEQVAGKFLRLQSLDLTPILCVGESLEDRNNGKYLQTIHRQLDAVFELVGLAKMSSAVLAYEPVWAVGTGKTATPAQAEEVHRYMRKLLGSQCESTTILYGGSVKASNAKELFALPDIDGALLGGASLDAEEFLAICKAAH